MGSGESKAAPAPAPAPVGGAENSSDGYSVRLSDNLKSLAGRSISGEIEQALEESYQKGVEEASRTLQARAFAIEGQMTAAMNQQLAAIQAQESEITASMLQKLKSSMFNPPPPKIMCVEQTQAVLQCYKLGEPLKCAALVKALTDCSAKSADT